MIDETAAITEEQKLIVTLDGMTDDDFLRFFARLTSPEIERLFSIHQRWQYRLFRVRAERSRGLP